MDYRLVKCLVSEAFEIGLSGCHELKSEMLDDLLSRHGIEKENDYKIWKIEDLQKMAEGSIFCHMSRGRFWISKRRNGQKYAFFYSGTAVEFNNDKDPWDKPIILLYSNGSNVS